MADEKTSKSSASNNKTTTQKKSAAIKKVNATSGVLIAEAVSSENGTKFGKVGDQKGGREVRISPFRDFGFTKVYRFRSSKVGELCARKARKIAESDLVGYSQSLDKDGRTSLYDALAEVNFIAGDLKTPCNTDCSAMAAACVSAVSERYGTSYKINKWCASGNIGSHLMNTRHFKSLSGAYYRTHPEALKPGDILVAPCKHVAIVL